MQQNCKNLCRGAAAVTQRRPVAALRVVATPFRSGAVSFSPLLTPHRRFSMPDPSDLFTSPAGLMALLYGRTGSSTPAASTALPSDVVQATGKSSRRALQQRRRPTRRPQGDEAAGDHGNGNNTSGHTHRADRTMASGPSSLFTTQAVVLALAIFLLSALWDLFTSQKSTIWNAVKNSVATTLEVRSSSQEFAMIVDWMGRQPHGQRIRNLGLRPVTVQDEQKAIWGTEEAADASHSAADADARVMLVPGYGSHLFRFGTTWVYITRSEDPSKQKAAAAHRVDRENDKLTLTFLTRRRAVVQLFMSHVRESWNDNVRNTVHIYLSEGYSARWRLLSERLRRPLNTLYLPAETKAIVEEARLFLRMKSTYAALGIPWRRGYLLEGPPGTGKSSFAMALAGELGLPLHILSLRSDNMDDDALLSLVSGLPPRSILLIEDFENALKAKHSVSTAEPPDAEGASPAVALTYSTDVGGGPRSALSLSALLNALDGVSSSEGRLLLITANDTSKIPFADALLRPGRIDRRIAFEKLQPQQIEEMEESFQRTLRERLPTIADAAATTHFGATEGSGDRSSDKDEGGTTCTPALYQQRLLNSVFSSSLHSAETLTASE
ncbi:putative mitochondrial ATP-dependent chaperone, putative,mitochondrial chaperone BCS1 [Leptomonas pyrrhocoris]|uniref:Putative mitochondrial ATP-dependent chaperone, putative,mitochondrial chaperone BCS1 n=1 Tax=Leptomonas pyrrhocoris TaxID=157538 RepID=A0A0M9G3R3_LEPPY|nr:putative mitochondrial ATP-dependent chaperone, putative,mitochondrial chaperone BCS1 [Leptomonas pyrrhocoris]KPA81633.1 putative mitochondrial ATP-dependent chaperone, putative,mitochondrial chaperone BCS1 [Leptomonas pyrrhocoris]|eukprot:XP_015660072.1 putative mitochondrial ATP-dependent chaperone, putative,mitochondrial chaperone BCS1 [Leptomonas pyrrhocoris]